METDAKGQLGGIDCTTEARNRMAEQSRSWRCGVCGISNEKILKESQDAAKEAGHVDRADEEIVPEQLRLTYREDLNKKENSEIPERSSTAEEQRQPARASTQVEPPSAGRLAFTGPPTVEVCHPASVLQNSVSGPSPLQGSGHEAATQTLRVQTHHRSSQILSTWIDKAILGIGAALLLMIVRKLVYL